MFQDIQKQERGMYNSVFYIHIQQNCDEMLSGFQCTFQAQTLLKWLKSTYQNDLSIIL